MTKNELAEKLAQILKITNVQGKQIADVIIEEMAQTLINGKRNIQLRGLGSFIVKNREAMRRKHPGSGKMITIPKQRVIRFIPGKELKKL